MAGEELPTVEEQADTTEPVSEPTAETVQEMKAEAEAKEKNPRPEPKKKPHPPTPPDSVL